MFARRNLSRAAWRWACATRMMCLWWITRTSSPQCLLERGAERANKLTQCIVFCRTDFPDSMTRMWDKNMIAGLLGSAFAPQFGHQRANNVQPTANIDVLVTFDSYGVSSHPNHISLYLGARSFVQALASESAFPSPVDLYTLTTVGITRKYSSFLDVFATLLSWKSAKGGDEEHPESLVFMNQLVGGHALGTAWRAMTEAHKSQMVWFRYGWITLSRYMVINDLRLEKFKAQQ